MMTGERGSNKRTCQSRWLHYMHKGQTPNHRTDLVWPQARPSRNHWPLWRHQRKCRFEKVKVGPFFSPLFSPYKSYFVITFVNGNIKYGVVGEVGCLIMTQKVGFALKYSEQIYWNTMKADTKSSPRKQIHRNTSTVDTLSGNALTCLMMKPVQSAHCGAMHKASKLRDLEDEHLDHPSNYKCCNKQIHFITNNAEA